MSCRWSHTTSSVYRQQQQLNTTIFLSEALCLINMHCVKFHSGFFMTWCHPPWSPLWLTQRRMESWPLISLEAVLFFVYCSYHSSLQFVISFPVVATVLWSLTVRLTCEIYSICSQRSIQLLGDGFTFNMLVEDLLSWDDAPSCGTKQRSHYFHPSNSQTMCWRL